MRINTPVHLNWYLFITLLLLVVSLPLLAEAITADDHPERFVKTHARIDWHQVVTPFPKILLIRQGNRFGAIRFTQFHRGNDAKPPTIFTEGKASEYAEYDWYYQGDGSGDFTRPNVESGHRKLVDRPLRGIGCLAFQTGTVHVKCGDFKLFWLYPTSVSFSSETACRDTSVELAPTRWDRIEDVLAHDPKITWYRCDEQRKSFLIPVEELSP